MQNAKDQQGHFGWGFSPPVRINAAKDTLELRQVVTTHQVMADLSVPSWWPRFSLNVESAGLVPSANPTTRGARSIASTLPIELCNDPKPAFSPTPLRGMEAARANAN